MLTNGAGEKNKRGTNKKVLLISILLFLLVIGFIWYSLLPWMANHYGFALPGEKGLPRRVKSLRKLQVRVRTGLGWSNEEGVGGERTHRLIPLEELATRAVIIHMRALL